MSRPRNLATSGRVKTYRPRGSIGSQDPLIRRIFERARELEMTDLDLAIDSGYSLDMIGDWRRGDAPGTKNLKIARDLGGAVGLELTWKEKE